MIAMPHNISESFKLDAISESDKMESLRETADHFSWLERLDKSARRIRRMDTLKHKSLSRRYC